MRMTITVQFKSGLRKEFLEKLIKNKVVGLKEIDLWKFPLAVDGADEKPVWYLTAEHNNDFDIQSLLRSVKEIEADNGELENNFYGRIHRNSGGLQKNYRP